MLNPIEKFKRSILHLNRSLHHWNVPQCQNPLSDISRILPDMSGIFRKDWIIHNWLLVLLQTQFKVWLNRYSWGAGKQGSGYVSSLRWLECISRRFLTMSRLLKSLYHLRSCRNSSEYSKTSGNFLPLLMIRLVRKFVWEIFNIISSDAHFRIFNLSLWCCCIRGILIGGGGSPCCPLMTHEYLKFQKTKNARH